MDTYTKIFLFFLSLDDSEKQQFRNLIGINTFTKIRSKVDLSYISSSINDLRPSDNRTTSDNYDIAIMQVVRHIANISKSNLELSKSVEEITGKRISRPEKRSKPELQGILLDALFNAPKDKLVKIKNKLIHQLPRSTADEKNQTNLDKWFSIILGTLK